MTLSRLQGQQGQGDKSETWLPAPSVRYTSWLLPFSDGRSIHAQLTWRYDLAAALASQPPFVCSFSEPLSDPISFQYIFFP